VRTQASAARAPASIGARAPASIAALALAAAAALLPAPAAAQQGVGDVVYVPTPQTVVDTMLDMAQVGPNDNLIDLGSGDGRVVVTAAKRGARSLGVDLDKVLLGQARQLAEREKVADRAAFREQNLFETDLSQATVVTSYLLPEMNLRLRPKILALKPGTRVVAHDYHMGDWLPDQRKDVDVPEKKVGNPGVSHVYYWVVPARVEGVWRGTAGGRAWEFAFKQRHQFVSGVARSGSFAGDFDRGRLVGEELRFSFGSGAEAREFVGRAVNGVIDGKLVGKARGKPVEERLTLKAANG
jgi:hypothetical protein